MTTQFNCVAMGVFIESMNYANNILIIAIYEPPNSLVREFNIELETIPG